MYSIGIGIKQKTSGFLSNVERTVIQYEDLEWTTEKPTQPGLYRAVSKIYNRVVWVNVLPDEYDEGNFRAWEFCKDYSNSIDDYVLWLGAIPEPPPPYHGRN